MVKADARFSWGVIPDSYHGHFLGHHGRHTKNTAFSEEGSDIFSEACDTHIQTSATALYKWYSGGSSHLWEEVIQESPHHAPNSRKPERRKSDILVNTTSGEMRWEWRNLLHIQFENHIQILVSLSLNNSPALKKFFSSHCCWYPLERN